MSENLPQNCGQMHPPVGQAILQSFVQPHLNLGGAGGQAYLASIWFYISMESDAGIAKKRLRTTLKSTEAFLFRNIVAAPE